MQRFAGQRLGGHARVVPRGVEILGAERELPLGEGGQRIKAIGARARAELEQMLERRIHLFLFVKVRENWIEDRERYTALGLDYDV